jgi:hypothetical protein
MAGWFHCVGCKTFSVRNSQSAKCPSCGRVRRLSLDPPTQDSPPLQYLLPLTETVEQTPHLSERALLLSPEDERQE